jgi:hypothetical protein
MSYLHSEIIRVFAPFAPLFPERVWRHAQVLLQGTMLPPGSPYGAGGLAGDGPGHRTPFYLMIIGS